MSQRVFLEESISLRSHLLALHAFPTAASRVAVNARAMMIGASIDLEQMAIQWAAEEIQGAPDAAENLAIVGKWQEVIHCETLLFCEQVSVYFKWMEEAFQAAHLAVLQGLCLFAKKHRSAEEDEEECEDEELVYVNPYVHPSLPEAAEIPRCDSISEASLRLGGTILPALRKAREQLDQSWQPARADWPENGAAGYEADHYAEIDRASEGFERVLENLIPGLDMAVQGLPPSPRR